MAGIYSLEDKDFGTIVICFRQGMRSVTARWKKDILHINAPDGMPVKNILKALDAMRERIASRKPPKRTFHNGQLIHCFRHTISIGLHNGKKNVVGYGGAESELYLNLHESADFNNENVNHTISVCLCNLMAERASGTLIPHARSIAESLGVNPAGFEIGHGKRKLGHCTSKGIIQLSYYIMFLPEDLVNYIIYHELAHLNEMNHSTDFHTLCNSYCKGKESHYKKALKNFYWPIIK